MNLYDVRNHLLLSTAAKELQPEVLVEYAQAAEDALGLSGTSYTTTRADRAKIAVVRQVNRMVAEPDDPFLTGHTRGAESKSWARPGSSGAAALDPVAVSIVETLAAEAAGAEAGEYVTVRGYR